MNLVLHLYAADIAVCVHRVEHLRVPQRVTETVTLIVKGFSREHVPVALGNDIAVIFLRCDRLFRFESGVIAAVRKIVIRVNILKQMAFFNISHAAGLAPGIKSVRDGVRAPV